MGRQSQPPAGAVIPQTTPTSGPRERYEKIKAEIERNHDNVARALAAVHISPERFFATTDQALRRSPRLLECTPSSIVRALLDAAELGLVPSGLVGQAYLVPYKNKHTKQYEAQLIPGYRGLIDLARRSGEVKAIEARTVREHDTFDIIFGTDGKVYHVPYINRTNETIEFESPDHPGELLTQVKDGGRFIGAYMIATLADGVKQVEWMSWAEIESIRRRSRAAGDGPWVTDPGEMGKKTVTRRGSKYLPIAIDSAFNRALALEEEAESKAATIRNVTPSTNRAALEGALGIATEEPEEAEPEEEPIGDDVPPLDIEEKTDGTADEG